MPWDVTAKEHEEDAQAIFMLDYMRLVGIALLYWDHAVTLDREVDLMWRRPRKSLSSYFFFLNRYFACFAMIPSAVVPFVTLSASACSRFCMFREVVLVGTQVIVAAVMITRVYALYGRSKRVLWGLLGFAGLIVAIAGWFLSGQRGWFPHTGLSGCHWLMNSDTALHLAGPWEALFALDAVIFCMTLVNAWSIRYARGPSTSLQRLVVRDGALYFGVVAAANLLNIATYYMDSPMFEAGSLATIASCVSVTTISRLMLNLHAYADRVGILSQPEPEMQEKGGQDLSVTVRDPERTTSPIVVSI
uniref:DUF6533 domain-containing protein n=1 Tax=Mycena chlorophos TaxID=658473 RepID=A0ABQ0LIP7_MYCCL|nr:predicted protein [Mycena chlorophos]